MVLQVRSLAAFGIYNWFYAGRPFPPPDLIKWLHHAHAAAFRLEHEGALDAKLKPYDQLSQFNVLLWP